MADKLTEEQRVEYTTAFNTFSKGGAPLDIKGVGSLFRYMGQNPAPFELQELMGGKATYTLSDFMNYVGRNMATVETPEDVMQAFQVFDKDGRGLISVPELRHILTALGDKLDPDDVEVMISQADQGDGHVSYQQFVELMMRDHR